MTKSYLNGQNDLDEYRKENKQCELYWCPFIPPKFRNPKASEINHIFRRLSNHRTNIIHLSAQAHRWFHEFPADGRIMCLLVKARKGELDLRELHRASGMWPLGWLEKSEPRLEWIVPYREELRKHLVELEDGQ